MNAPFIAMYVYWDGSTLTNETDRILSFSVERSTMAKNSVFPKHTMSPGKVVFNNVDWRYSPRTGEGVDTSIHQYIYNMPIDGFQFFAKLENDDLTVDKPLYYGRLTECTFNETDGTATFTISPESWVLIQRADSTGVYKDIEAHNLIRKYIDDVGLNVNSSLGNSSIHVGYAWLGKDNALSDMADISNATLSYLYEFVNDLGMPTPIVFDTYDLWYEHIPGPEIFSPELNYSDMETTLSSNLRATKINVEYSPRDISGISTLYELDERLFCPPNKTKTFTLKTTRPIYLYNDLKINVDYGISLGSGMDAKDHVSVSFIVYAQEILMTVENRHPSLEAIVEWLTFSGVGVDGNPSRMIEETIIDVDPFRRDKNFDMNFYIQNSAHAQWLANVGKYRLSLKQLGVEITDIPVTRELIDNVYVPMNIGTAVRYQHYNDSAIIDGYIVACSIRQQGERLSIDVRVINRDVLYERNDYCVLKDSGTFTNEDRVFC